MSDYPSDLRYTRDHEWVLPNGNQWRVGITKFATEQLGEVVFVELPKVGTAFSKGDAIGSIESVKAVSEIYAPVSGKVTAVNGALDSGPERVNNDPHGEGWMIDLEPSNKAELDELLDAARYAELVAEEAK
jgi:glycine cleavage system H protein